MIVLIQTQEMLIALQNQKIRNSLERNTYKTNIYERKHNCLSDYGEILDYSREKASEVLGWISPEWIEEIENENTITLICNAEA